MSRLSVHGFRNLILAMVFFFLSACGGGGSFSNIQTTGLKAQIDKLTPDKEVEFETVAVDYTDPNQNRGNFSEKKLMEQFEDSAETTVFNGSFFMMNIEKVDAKDPNSSNLKWETHGNWCGKDRLLGKKNPMAVDGLDQLCKAHKTCYRETWDGNCSCDDKLLRSLQSLESTPRELVKGMEEYYSRSQCVFKCRYLSKWKDAYIFEQGESRIPQNIKNQFSSLPWGIGKLNSDKTKYISTSRDYNYVCIEDEDIFQKFEQCAKNRAGSLHRLQCLESYIKKGIVTDIDWDASGPRDTMIKEEQ